jgi:formylglycine-generating enzyme required for sulfatase activity
MVRAGEFCIDSTEVTARQYLAFLEEADLSKQPPGCPAMNTTFAPLNVEVTWPPTAGQEDYPVVNVDWCDAASFCQWSGKRLCGHLGPGALDSKQAAMPAVSRWASACTRAGTWKLPYGPDAKPGLCNVGNPNRPLHIVPVGSMPGCQGGYDKLYDMVGNVEEWLDACRTDPARGEVCGVIGGRYFDSEMLADCGRLDEVGKLRTDYFRGFRCCWP